MTLFLYITLLYCCSSAYGELVETRGRCPFISQRDSVWLRYWRGISQNITTKPYLAWISSVLLNDFEMCLSRWMNCLSIYVQVKIGHPVRCLYSFLDTFIRIMIFIFKCQTYKLNISYILYTFSYHLPTCMYVGTKGSFCGRKPTCLSRYMTILTIFATRVTAMRSQCIITTIYATRTLIIIINQIKSSRVIGVYLSLIAFVPLCSRGCM